MADEIRVGLSLWLAAALIVAPGIGRILREASR